jgi:hypothetical protein
MIEIDSERFCVLNSLAECRAKYTQDRKCVGCDLCHRKWPTSEQFEEEYGRKPDAGQAVYAHKDVWFPSDFFWTQTHKHLVGIDSIVIACTPYGRPPADFLSKEDAGERRQDARRERDDRN